MENTKTTFTEKVINGLRKAATELEELRVQAALGKSEAKDAFQDARKNFDVFIHDSKEQLEHASEITKEKATELKSTLEHLRVQVALGSAEAKDTLEEQMKKIKTALNKIEESFFEKK